jgi:Tfp pilus assembly protein PilF
VSMMNLQRYDDAFETFTGLLPATSVGERNGAAAVAAVYNNLGVVQMRRGASPQSGTPTYFFTKATDADPGEIDYLFNLGYAYVLERNFQGAIYWLREALRRNPADADAHFVLAGALQAAGSTTEATRERELARQLSEHYEDLERKAQIDRLAVPADLERVQADADGSGALRPDLIVVTSTQRDQRETAAFHLERGRRLFDREQDTDALAELRRAVYLSPYEAEAHFLIARIYLRAGRPGDAIEALKISIWSSDTAAARLALAQAYLKTGDKPAARAEAERALGLDPASSEAKRLLAEIR